jgi:hypothetical protein
MFKHAGNIFAKMLGSDAAAFDKPEYFKFFTGM